MTTTVTRRLARESAFQFLFGNMPMPTEAEAALSAVKFFRPDYERFCASFEQSPSDFSWEVVEGTGQNLPSVDAAITKLSTNWRIERMSRVDLTILRLAAFEILFRPDIPKTVSINEAVELAKRFGAEDSPAFINGILDKLDKPAEL